MWPFPRTAQYERVRQAHDLSDDDEYVKAVKKTAQKEQVVNLACLVAVLSTIYTLTVSIAIPPLPSFATKKPLRRPDQYLGLERVNYANATAFKDIEITTFATAMQPIDSLNPSAVYGPVSSDDKHFIASNTISTIVQFRVRDWGMERCHLTMNLPRLAEHLPIPSGGERRRDWTLEGDTSGLDVWMVSTPHWIDPNSLSWNSKPRRLRWLSILGAHRNVTTQSAQFDCPSDSIQSFEFTCASPNCRVDIWQDGLKPLVGLALTQQSSI